MTGNTNNAEDTIRQHKL